MTQRRAVIKFLLKMIKKSKIDFDTVVFRGMSGCLMGPSIADALEKPFLVIRKENDGSHSSSLLEGHAEVKKFIIIDDLIDSGRTIRTILANVKDGGKCEAGFPNAVCVGIFLYSSSSPIDMFQKDIPVYGCICCSGDDVQDRTFNPERKYPQKKVEKVVDLI